MVAAILELQIRHDSWFSVASFLPSDEQSSYIEINGYYSIITKISYPIIPTICSYPTYHILSYPILSYPNPT